MYARDLFFQRPTGNEVPKNRTEAEVEIDAQREANTGNMQKKRAFGSNEFNSAWAN